MCVFFNVIVSVLSIVEKVTSLFGYFNVLRKLENLWLSPSLTDNVTFQTVLDSHRKKTAEKIILGQKGTGLCEDWKLAQWDSQYQQVAICDNKQGVF